MIYLENLRKLRTEKDLTQIALQMQTGIDQALLSKYETGERIPTVENLITLADYYGTNLDYLLDRTDIAEPLPKSRASTETGQP